VVDPGPDNLAVAVDAHALGRRQRSVQSCEEYDAAGHVAVTGSAVNIEADARQVDELDTV